KFGGIVECDETYVGGRPRNKRKGKQGFKRSTKMTVMGVLQRGGEVRLRVLARRRRITGATVGRVLRRFVDPSATLHTDESVLYKSPAKRYAGHETVNHTRLEYARGDVTTNSIEGTFSLLKRGLF